MIDEREILEALQKATIAAVAASDTPLLPVKYIGRSQVPPSDQKWLEFVFIPNTPDNQTWGDELNYMGMFRLVLHWPNDETGAYPALDVLKSICAYFTKDRRLDGVKITNAPKLLSVLEQPTEALYPATIRFAAFRQGA